MLTSHKGGSDRMEVDKGEKGVMRRTPGMPKGTYPAHGSARKCRAGIFLEAEELVARFVGQRQLVGCQAEGGDFFQLLQDALLHIQMRTGHHGGDHLSEAEGARLPFFLADAAIGEVASGVAVHTLLFHIEGQKRCALHVGGDRLAVDGLDNPFAAKVGPREGADLFGPGGRLVGWFVSGTAYGSHQCQGCHHIGYGCFHCFSYFLVSFGHKITNNAEYCRRFEKKFYLCRVLGDVFRVFKLPTNL